MKVATLNPQPESREPFRRDRQKFVPSKSGCYVLAAFEGEILYVGLASNLRQRVGQHLDNPAKVEPGPHGRAVWFHWLEFDHLERLERTWMNQHLVSEGRLPVLNGAYSPVGL